MIPPEVVKQAMASGWTIDDIAWDQGVTTAEVCRVMRQLEMSREVVTAGKQRSGAPRKGIPLKELRAARARGESCAEIAARYGVCAETVRRRLRGAR
jgi:transposase